MKPHADHLSRNIQVFITFFFRPVIAVQTQPAVFDPTNGQIQYMYT